VSPARAERAAPPLARLERLLEEGLEKLERKLETMHLHMLKEQGAHACTQHTLSEDAVSEPQGRLNYKRARASIKVQERRIGSIYDLCDDGLNYKTEKQRASRHLMLRQASDESVGPAAMARQMNDRNSDGSASRPSNERNHGEVRVVRTQGEETLPNNVRRERQASFVSRTTSFASSVPRVGNADSDSDGELKKEKRAADILVRQIRRASTMHDEIFGDPEIESVSRSGNLGTGSVDRGLFRGSMMGSFFQGGTTGIRSSMRKGVTKGLSVLAPSFWHKVANRSETAETVWTFFEEPETTWVATVYQNVACVFILLTCLIPVLQTLPEKPLSNEAYFWISTVTDALFMVELCVRFAVCPSSKNFFLGFYNLLDIAIIGPFILRCVVCKLIQDDDGGDITTGEDILLCVVPVMRMIKALRSIPNFVLLWHTLKVATPSMAVPMYMLSLTIVIFSSAFYVIEPRTNIISMPHAMWFVVVTISTVGYGDLYPVTDLGRLCTSVLIFCGLLFMAMPIAIVGGAFLETWKNRVRILAIGRIHRRLSQWGYTEDDLKILFKTFDADFNNLLDFREFSKMVETMRLGLSEENVVRLFSVFDVDGDDALDMDEFVGGIGLNKPGQMFIIF